MQSIQHRIFDNSLHLITESVNDVRTAAIEWVIPAGVATNEHDGDSVLLAELMYRGAGGLTAREHAEALDRLGLSRTIACGSRFIAFHGLLLGSRASESIGPIADMLLRPTLPSDELGATVQLCLQSLDSIQDNPSRLVHVALNEHHLPAPFNRSMYGERLAIESASIERLQGVHQTSFNPTGSILSIVGDIDHDEVSNAVHQQTNAWSGDRKEPEETASAIRGIHHIQQDTSQVHIGFAFDAPIAKDDDSILERIAVSIFGGATSGRLFTEIRQKRSLCYSVHASYQASRERSSVRIHAGTTPARAAETIEVILDQLEILRSGVTKEEFTRSITRLRARTVMHGESTVARSRALLGDQDATGKTKTLQERLDELLDVTHDAVNAYLASRLFGTMTLVSLGSETVDIDENRILNIN